MPELVLVIEDNPDNLYLMTYLLGALGYEPISATNGLDGIELARLRQPALILCDILLPDIDGYQLASRCKSDPALCDIPLVAVTALAMLGDREKALKAGFNGYLSKPIEPELFAKNLTPFLKRPTSPA